MSQQISDFKTALDLDMALKGVNERELGLALNVAQQSINKWRQRGFPPMYRIEQLRKYFGPDSYLAKMDITEVVKNVPRLRAVAPDGETRARMESAPIGPVRLDRAKEWRLVQQAEFFSHLPRPLRANFDPEPVMVGDKGVSATYMSDRLVAIVIYCSSHMALDVNSARATLALAALKALEQRTARYVLIVVRNPDFDVEREVPGAELGAALGVECVDVESGEQAAIFVAVVEAEEK